MCGGWMHNQSVTNMITSTTPTTDEIAAHLMAVVGERGGSDVAPVADGDDVSPIGLTTTNKHGHRWIKTSDVRAYLKRQLGRDRLLGDLVYNYRLRASVREVVRLVGVLVDENQPTTTKELVKRPRVWTQAIEAAVAMGLIETYRPARRRTDWHRIP